MRIGFDTSDLVTARADGTTRYTAELARRLPELEPDIGWEYYAPGTSHVDLPESSSVRWISSPWPRLWTQTRLPFDLHRYRPDVLFMPIQQLPVVRPRGMKTVAVVHDLAFQWFGNQYRYKDWALLHTFTAHAVRHADRIIAVSAATARDIERVYGRTEGVQAISHGVDTAHFTTEGESQNDLQMIQVEYPELQSPYLLFVGQIQPRKNIERLIAAFELLWEKDPELQLLIGGGHGWLQKPILERVRSSKAAKQILMPGRVPDALLPALYRQAEAFVMPSLYEGFGMPLLEAMACGCPVVTGNVSSMPEVVGEAGVVVDPYDVDALAAGIRDARSRRNALSTAGSERAQQFTWERTARETLAVLKD